jgi:phosphoribosylaminoimidazole carboxylase (NCAIR synthetase)
VNPGGGQLGRMMIEAGNKIGVRIAILDPGICSSWGDIF